MVKNVKESKTKCGNLRTSFVSCIHGMDDLVVYLHCFCILPLSRLKSRSEPGLSHRRGSIATVKGNGGSSPLPFRDVCHIACTDALKHNVLLLLAWVRLS